MTDLVLSRWPFDLVQSLATEHNVQVWPVGGLVRDALLGRATHDWDLVVERDAITLARAVADAIGGSYYPLDKDRDVGRVILAQENESPLVLDFAAMRGPDLTADLQLRDFTINAMAIGPDGQIIDPLGGQADLETLLLRAVSQQALAQDPLRMLRAVRLRAELGLRLDALTANWIILGASTLTSSSAERIRDEFVRILAAPAPAEHLHMLDELQLLEQIIPQTAPLKKQQQSPPHRFDVWWHTLMVADGVDSILQTVDGVPPTPLYTDPPPEAWQDVHSSLAKLTPKLTHHLEENGGRVALLLAALLHDIGKPLTCSEDEQGLLHFFGHEAEGATMTGEIMEALRFSRAEIERGQTMVKAHLRPAHLARSERPVTRRAIYRFFRATGTSGVGTVLLSLADHLATWGPNLVPEIWASRLGVAETLLRHYFEQHLETISPPPLVKGSDLMAALELEAGPEIGKLLGAIEEAQAAGEIGTDTEALALARRLAGKD